MSNGIQVVNSSLPANIPQQQTFTHSGDNGVQIANQAGGTINVYSSIGATGVVYNAVSNISNECYNLFVVDGDTICDPFFIVEKERALTIAEGVAPEISARFATLTPNAIAEIKTFPSLFSTVNRRHGCTDTDHLALYGFVTKIQIQENGIKVYFQSRCSIPQQMLIDIAPKLAILKAPLRNEFDRTHWSIKQIDLVAELKSIGIRDTFLT